MDGSDGNGLQLEKELANFFKFLLYILEVWRKSDYNLFLLGKMVSYFLPGALGEVALSQIFIPFGQQIAKFP